MDCPRQCRVPASPARLRLSHVPDVWNQWKDSSSKTRETHLSFTLLGSLFLNLLQLSKKLGRLIFLIITNQVGDQSICRDTKRWLPVLVTTFVRRTIRIGIDVSSLLEYSSSLRLHILLGLPIVSRPSFQQTLARDSLRYLCPRRRTVYFGQMSRFRLQQLRSQVSNLRIRITALARLPTP